jgi:membrane protein implicated in regulation of membrane protease activity
VPGLVFAVVFVGGAYTLFALVEHSWWKPLVVMIAAPLVVNVTRRGFRRWRRTEAPDQASGGGLVGRRSSRVNHHGEGRRP